MEQSYFIHKPVDFAVVLVGHTRLLATLCNFVPSDNATTTNAKSQHQASNAKHAMLGNTRCASSLLFTLFVYQLNAHCPGQFVSVVGTLHDNRGPSCPCGCVNSGELGDEGDEEAAEHRPEGDEEHEDAVQQDRRASHAKASTRHADEQMPDAAHDAGLFARPACCKMLHLLGVSVHALTLVHQGTQGVQPQVHV